MAMRVLLSAAAKADFDALPATIRVRVQAVFVRLVAWPAVSGAKSLRGEMHGHYRVRTGDYRIILRVIVAESTVMVVRIAHRSTVYDD